jgi:hypothetical protein
MPKINLGKTMDDMISIKPIDKDETHYPDLMIADCKDKRIAQMPDKGEATITYRVVSRTHREEKDRGYSCSVRLEILSIDPPAGSKKRNGYGDDVRKSFDNYFKNK